MLEEFIKGKSLSLYYNYTKIGDVTTNIIRRERVVASSVVSNMAESVVHNVNLYISQLTNRYEDSVSDIINRAVQYKNNSVDSRRGFIFEEWTRATYNNDAIIKGLRADAVTPKSTSKNSPDIIFGDGRYASLKSYKNAEASIKAQSNPGYEGQVLVIPKDQYAAKDNIIDSLVKTDINKQRVGAEQWHRKLGGKLSDRISSENGVSSTPISNNDLNMMSKAIKKDGTYDEQAFEQVMKSNGEVRKFKIAKVKKELSGLGIATAIGFGIGFGLGVVCTLAQAGIHPDSFKYAIVAGARMGLETGVQSIIGYGIGRTIGQLASNAMQGLLKNIGMTLTDNVVKMCNMGAIGVLTIAVFSAISFVRMIKKGESIKSAAIKVGLEALFSLSLLALSIAAQGIWGGYAGLIVSVSTGIIVMTYGVVDIVHTNKFRERVREYTIDKCIPAF